MFVQEGPLPLLAACIRPLPMNPDINAHNSALRCPLSDLLSHHWRNSKLDLSRMIDCQVLLAPNVSEA